MKLSTRIIICCLTVALLLCTLTSCIDGDRAKQTIESFLSAVEAGDYDAAKAFLHPDRPADVQQYLEKVENTESVDFQSDIEILRYSSVKSSHYDSSVGGSAYETTCNARVGGREVSITVEIVENDAGYGIYNFTIDF